MVIVTDLKYHLETKLVEKLDLMIARCIDKQKRKDAVLIIEGSEGEGKTNTSEAIAYYVKDKTKRDIHMFFRLKQMFDFAKSTEGKIIIWDEPSLDSLSTDWYSSASKDLIRLLMTCRKKRHFLIFNFVKFYKFSEYIVVDRSLALIHMYSRNETQSGRFIYIKKKCLEMLYADYKQKKKRNYKKYMSFGGSFPIVEKHLDKMGLIIEGVPNCTLQMYEELKDKAINSMGDKTKENPELLKYKELKVKLSKLKFPILTKEQFSLGIGINPKTIYKWGKALEDTESIEITSESSLVAE